MTALVAIDDPNLISSADSVLELEDDTIKSGRCHRSPVTVAVARGAVEA